MPRQRLKITPRQMAISVRRWLLEENATIDQALALQSAIEAGLIVGIDYNGHRRGNDDYVSAVPSMEGPHVPEERTPGCGCLLDTFEQLQNKRTARRMPEYTARTFALAMTLDEGDTPQNSAWARAAVRGIKRYVAARERRWVK